MSTDGQHTASPETATPMPTARPLHIRLLRSLLFVCAGTFIGLVLLILVAENKFIYFPSTAGDWTIPAASQGAIEELSLPTTDGCTLNAWYYKAAKRTKLTILYLHGNAGNLAQRHGWTAALTHIPANVLIIDYRGYGKSTGTPSEAGLYADAETAYDYLTKERKVKRGNLVIYGKSLGGGPATQLAMEKRCAALILQSTYTSVPDMAHVQMFGLPLGWVVRTQFATKDKIGKIAVPKLFVHSRDDELIPFWMAEELHRRAQPPKKLLPYSGAGHNDLIAQRGMEVMAAFRDFLKTARPQ